MALTPSNPFAVGTLAPDFTLIDTVTNHHVSLKNLKGEVGTVVMFICNHCPYVVRINQLLVEVANQFIPLGISFIAISSNDIQKYPQDSPHLMKKVAVELEYPFPYLFDEDQKTARSYNAACTPDFYLFDKKLQTVYHGQFDESSPNNSIPLSGKHLKEAMNRLINSQEPIEEQLPSIGCSIKWK